MKWKMALLAGLATLSFAASAVPAHAITGNWTMIDSFPQAQTYACRVPGVGGSTVRILLDGGGSEAVATMIVFKVNRATKKFVSEVAFHLLLDQVTAEGELFVPDDRRYIVEATLGSDDPSAYLHTQVLNVPDLALC